MRTEISIEVRAAPRTVFDRSRDIASWPRVLPHYRKVTIRSRNGAHVTADMHAVRFIGPLGLPVGWRSEHWSDDSDPTDLQLRFVHVAGATRGMDVTWHIRPANGGSRVTIEHDFRRHVPLLGDEVFPWLVDRFFVRPIAGRTLATFKQLAEAGR